MLTKSLYKTIDSLCWVFALPVAYHKDYQVVVEGQCLQRQGLMHQKTIHRIEEIYCQLIISSVTSSKPSHHIQGLKATACSYPVYSLYARNQTESLSTIRLGLPLTNLNMQRRIYFSIKVGNNDVNCFNFLYNLDSKHNRGEFFKRCVLPC